MDEAPVKSDTCDTAEQPRKKRLSMHDGIAVWADCCSCEAEPYWVEIGREMGIEQGSDYEDEAAPPATPKP